MIVYHSKNVAAFKGNYAVYFNLQPWINTMVAKTSAAPADTLIAQVGSINRFMFSRIFGGIN